jgi:hypothetical protein
VTVNVNGADAGAGSVGAAASEDQEKAQALAAKLEQLQKQHDELVAQMGDQISSFPDAGVDGFLSHFILSMEFLQGDLKGRTLSLTMPPATQTVSRSAPFIYRKGAKNSVKIQLPADCTLPDTIAEEDFLEKPDGYFEDGKETVWMQILNLDARMEVPDLGYVRIILGETLKREHPDIFEPSFGVAQALGSKGFPAKLFFNPYALVETPMGSFRAVHGTLAYGRITDFPPVGTPVSISSAVPLEHIADIQEGMRLQSVDRPRDVEVAKPFARLIALSHPIDVPMQISGDEAFNFVEQAIAKAGSARGGATT